MKRKMDRLDQRLGDFGPLQRPINELDVERLLDRYGVALVCDYPELLFERRDQLLLPGWRYREAVPEYPRFAYRWPSPIEDNHPAVGMTFSPRAGPDPPGRLFSRLSDAYRILEEIYAPVQRASRPRHSTSSYGANDNSSYSQGTR